MRKIKFDEFELNENKELAENTSAAEPKKIQRPKNILEAFEKIVEHAENSNLSDEFFEKVKVQINYAVRKLNLTKMQAVLLAIFVDRSEDNRIMLSELAKFCGCRTTRFLRISTEIEGLVSQRYVRQSNGRNSVSYRVPSDVLDALRRNEPYVFVNQSINDTADFFNNFAILMNEKNDNELTTKKLIDQTKENLEAIRNSHFAMSLNHFHLCQIDMLLFTYMAHLFIENNDDNIIFNDIENIFDNDKIPINIKNELRKRTSDLFKFNLIENTNEDGMARPDAFKLTDFAKQDILSELNLSNTARSDKGLIQPDSFPEKKLIYNSAENKQITELSSILSEKRFADIQSRLRDASMRTGFCCLFYGSPGTGKTETVYQLARQTGRSILRVDVDKIKSCWVGESEKNIKALFTRYKNICKNSPLAPILLFNEADAVLGVRMEGASHAVDKMENSIQNIILQEMESLEGIMIATTNLTSNFDKAFERRFLYKIKFNKPSVEARTKIWQEMIPNLSHEQAFVLSSEFDLSGGEIENIARKSSVASILSGEDTINFNSIIDYCKDERINKSSRTKIGF